MKEETVDILLEAQRALKDFGMPMEIPTLILVLDRLGEISETLNQEVILDLGDVGVGVFVAAGTLRVVEFAPEAEEEGVAFGEQLNLALN
jgi:hypothetical protein